MPNYKANVNLVLGMHKNSVHVAKGEVFACDEAWAHKHLLPFNHAEETDEKPTEEVKMEERKAGKVKKKGKE